MGQIGVVGDLTGHKRPLRHPKWGAGAVFCFQLRSTLNNCIDLKVQVNDAAVLVNPNRVAYVILVFIYDHASSKFLQR